LVHAILTQFVNHAQKFKWLAKRMSYAKAERAFNHDTKDLGLQI